MNILIFVSDKVFTPRYLNLGILKKKHYLKILLLETKGHNISVRTLSLNDAIYKYCKNISPSYISIDTEGSEYEIMRSFNFNLYRLKYLQ